MLSTAIVTPAILWQYVPCNSKSPSSGFYQPFEAIFEAAFEAIFEAIYRACAGRIVSVFH
jgi:hypothetical protein